MDSFSLWQMGRNEMGRFSSMTPHTCPTGSCQALGYIGIGIQAVQTIAMFGIWYELHKMNKLSLVQFEERRLSWLDQNVEQWIVEHKNKAGIIIDVTKSLSKETVKVLEKLGELEAMDLPQVLLLKVKRLSEYFDKLSEFWTTVISYLTVISGSDPKWKLPIYSSEEITQQFIDDTHKQISEQKYHWLFVALGIPSCFIPIVGPTIGSGLIGGGFGAWLSKRSELKKIERLSQYPELIRLPIATDQLLITAAIVEEFLKRQNFEIGTHLYGVNAGAEKINLLLGPEKGIPLFKRIWKKPNPPILKAIKCPEENKAE